jgi:two-component sensor histidine kinase
MSSDQPDGFPTPPNESERLESLRSYDILDTPDEETFDNLTQLASQVFDFPIVLISLVDKERAWFKSNHGCDFKQVERSATICNTVTCRGEPMLISNTDDSPVARDKPMIREEGIQTYYGAPIENDQGHVLGTLCMLDFEERELSDQQVGQLKTLADVVMEKIEHRHTKQELEQSVQQRDQILDEIHHRVKNNLNTAISLIRTRFRQNPDLEPSDGKAIENRIESMALLHEHLYETAYEGTTDPGQYFRQLLDKLQQSYREKLEDVELEVDVELQQLESSIAIKCGLIVTELVTNAMEHAFEEKQGTGNVTVGLFERNGERLLEVEDDGRGLPDDFDVTTDSQFGLQLVRSLSEQNLDGDVSVDSDAGTTFRVTF